MTNMPNNQTQPEWEKKLDEMDVNVSNPRCFADEEQVEKLKLLLPIAWDLFKPSIKSFMLKWFTKYAQALREAEPKEKNTTMLVTKVRSRKSSRQLIVESYNLCLSLLHQNTKAVNERFGVKLNEHYHPTTQSDSECDACSEPLTE